MEKILRACLFFVFFFLYSYSHAADSPVSNIYVNKKAAIRVNFPEGWNLYTDEKNAPDQFKNFFKDDNKGNQSALFIASHPDQETCARLITEKYEGSAGEYFELLYSLQREKIDVLSAKYDVLDDIIQWSFKTKAGPIELTFFETLTKKGNSIVRLAFWTMSPVFERYRTYFQSITQETAFLRTRNGSQVWDPEWKELGERLDGGDLEFVRKVEQIKKR